MLINQNIENAARIAMGPLVLDEPATRTTASASGNIVRLVSSIALAAVVVAAALAIFF